jgi:metal-responsive CopG/Arc/MetJ family transcriptional regulator
MKGVTISVTIPKSLFDDYNQQADKLGTSRSKVICNILMNEYNIRKSGGNQLEGILTEFSPPSIILEGSESE